MPSHNDQDHNGRLLVPRWLLGVIIFGGIIATYAIGLAHFADGQNYEPLAILFAALAFGGVIFTIVLQSDELKLQRKELQLTREELKRTADAQQLSAYLNAYNSLFMAFTDEAANEEKMSYKFATDQRAGMLATLHSLVISLGSQLDPTMRVSSVDAARHWLARFAVGFAGFRDRCIIDSDWSALYRGLSRMPKILRSLLGTIDPHEGESQQLTLAIRDIIAKSQPVQQPDVTHGEEDFKSPDKQAKWSEHSEVLIEMMFEAAKSFAP